MRRLLYVLITVFFIASASFMGYLWSKNKDEKRLFIQENIETIEASFTSLLLKQRQKIHSIYETHITKDDVTQLLLHVKEAKIQREHLFFRGELYEKLLPLYQTLQTFGAKELNIFLSTNTSFLQMHQPQTLSNYDAHAMVAYVSKYRQPLEGLEIQEGFYGWRYVYPIFYENEYVGSVEFVFDLVDVIAPLGQTTLKKAGKESTERDTSFLELKDAHQLSHHITLSNPATKEPSITIVLTKKTDVLAKKQQHFILIGGLFGFASLLLLISLFWIMTLSKKQRDLHGKFAQKDQEVGRLQRVLINYETFLNLMEYWRRPLDAVITRLDKNAKEQGNDRKMILSSKALQLLSQVLDDFTFSYEKEKETVRIIPLFEAIWQIKQLYEVSFKEDGIELSIENGTKTLVSIKLVTIIQAIVNILLFIKEQMERQKKIPGHISISLFDDGASVCVKIKGAGVTFGLEDGEESLKVPLHTNRGLHLSQMIVVREHSGILDVVHDKEESYFKLCLPAIKEIDKKK